ncbi:MAG: TonB-dependent receptor, partial [Pacificimonas sp.]
LRARYGERDSLDVGAALVETVGDGFITVDASYAEGDGFFTTAPEDRGLVDTASPYEQAAITVRGVVPVGAMGEIQVRGSAFTDDRQRGQALVTSGVDGADASVRYLHRGDVPVEILAYVQARDYRATFARTAPDRSTEQPALSQEVPSTGLGAKAEARPSFGNHAFRVGADWRHADGQTQERFDFEDGVLSASRSAGGVSNIVGIFIEDDWQITDRLILTGGARLDYWSLTDGRFVERGNLTRFDNRDGWEPTGRLGAAYEATGALTLRGAAYLGWRLPTLNELYRPFRVGPDAVAANADLDPERSRGAEIGFDYRPLSTASIGVTGFVMRAENAIANITLDQGPGVFPGVGFVFGSFRQRLNLDAVDAYGIEARADLQFGPVTLDASYAYTDSKSDGSGPTSAQDGFLPPQIPKHRAYAAARVRILGDGSIGASLRYVGEQFEDDLEMRPLDDFISLDAHADIPLTKGFILTLAGENITDARIEDGIDVRGATTLAQPQTFWAGLKWRM